MTSFPDAFVGEVEALSSEEFIWKVNIFDTLATAIGEAIWSPKFKCLDLDANSCHCYLKLYPKGNTVESQKNISLFLVCAGINEIEVSYTMSLINLNNEKVFEKKTTNVIFNSGKNWNAFGFSKFCAIPDLMDPGNNVFNDNCLSISCKLKFYEKASSNHSETKININRSREFSDFEKLLRKKNLSDVTLMADDKLIHAHKCILAARSPVFEAIFSRPLEEKIKQIIKIDDMKAEVLKEFVGFIYTGKVNNVNKIVCELLTAAEKYSVLGLKAMCENVMCENLSQDTALEYLHAAEMNNTLIAKSAIIQYISRNLEDLFPNPKFKSFALKNPEIMYTIVQNKLDTDEKIKIEKESHKIEQEISKRKRRKISHDY